MKKLAVLLIGLICLNACTSEKNDSYNIAVTIQGVSNGVAYLCEKGSGFGPTNIKTAIDSAQVVNGACLFKGKVLKPLMVDMVVRPQKGEGNIPFRQFTMVLENKIYDVSCDYSTNGGFLQGARLVVKGSPMNDKSVAFAKILDPINAKRSKLLRELRQAKLNKDKEQLEDLNHELNRLEDSYKKHFSDLIEKNPKNIELCLLVSSKYGRSTDHQLLEHLLGKFDSSMHETKFLNPLVKRIDGWKITKKGMLAPEITAKDVEGISHSLSDLRGKYVLVDFWATWCGPCCKEIPEIVELYAQYKDKQFEVLGVSFDSKAEKWKKAIKKYKMEWLNISDLDHGKRLAALYAITGIPYNVLVDPEGKIIAKDLHGEDLKRKLIEILGE